MALVGGAGPQPHRATAATCRRSARTNRWRATRRSTSTASRSLTYVLLGVCVGVATLLYVPRLGSASPTTGLLWELEAIAAVIVGGTALEGRRRPHHRHRDRRDPAVGHQQHPQPHQHHQRVSERRGAGRRDHHRRVPAARPPLTIASDRTGATVSPPATSDEGRGALNRRPSRTGDRHETQNLSAHRARAGRAADRRHGARPEQGRDGRVDSGCDARLDRRRRLLGQPDQGRAREAVPGHEGHRQDRRLGRRAGQPGAGPADGQQDRHARDPAVRIGAADAAGGAGQEEGHVRHRGRPRPDRHERAGRLRGRRQPGLRQGRGRVHGQGARTARATS